MLQILKEDFRNYYETIDEDFKTRLSDDDNRALRNSCENSAASILFLGSLTTFIKGNEKSTIENIRNLL